MKTKLELGNIKVKELGIDISNVKVEAEYGMGEMFKIVDLMKYMTASLPEMIENLANAYLTFEEASDHIADIMNIEEDSEDEYMEGCCPVKLPSKEEFVNMLLKDMSRAVKASKEKDFKKVLDEVRNVADDNAKKEEIEDTLAAIKADMDNSDLPDVVKETILESLEDDLRNGRVIVRRK